MIEPSFPEETAGLSLEKHAILITTLIGIRQDTGQNTAQNLF
jgi:hypothetical protein